MATHAGKEGAVYIGANQIAEVIDWSVDESMTPIDDSELSDTWDTHLAGPQNASGQMTCHWDETDTNGQGAMTNAASVTLNLYPEGNSSGDVFYTGTVSITSIGRSASRQGTVQAVYGFTVNGALTQSTVS